MKSELSEKIIPIATWIVITFPLWMSFFHPAIVAYFIILFFIFFFYKSIKTAYLATLSYKRIQEKEKISFPKKLLKLKQSKEIYHLVVIPHYNEPSYKLESTLQSVTSTDYPYKHQFILVLGCEEREEGIQEKAKKLVETHEQFFKDILVVYHNLLPHEAPGKASNQTFAVRKADEYLQKLGVKRENVIVTICDADSHMPKNYFSYLTYRYLTDNDRLYHFYWGAVLLYNNFLKLPIFSRMQATLSSIIRMAFLSQDDNLIQTSTYSTSLWLLHKINFWDVDIIPEDWHIYLQAFFTFGERVKTLPLYTIINSDAVHSGGNVKTFVNRYEQEKRWAWGASDIGYAVNRFFNTPHLPVWPKIKKIAFLMETHLLWPTSFFVLTISASIPALVNPYFKSTVLGFLLPQVAGLILTITSVFLILYIYLDIKVRHKLNQKTPVTAFPFLVIQWYFLPVISFFLSALPALDAHTRMLFGKKIHYKVTEKV